MNQKPIGVVPRQENLLHHSLHPFFSKIEVVSSHQRRVYEVKTNSIRSELTADLHRVRVVLETFRHLLSLLGQDQTINDQVFIRIHV